MWTKGWSRLFDLLIIKGTPERLRLFLLPYSKVPVEIIPIVTWPQNKFHNLHDM